MTSHLEVLSPEGEWWRVKILQPGETSSFTNYLPGKSQELYIFKCSEDNARTIILKKINPRQVRLSPTETFVPASSSDQVVQLSEGEEFRLPIIIQNGSNAEVRVIHRIP